MNNYNNKYNNNRVNYQVNYQEKAPFNINIDWYEKAKKVITEGKNKITANQLRNILSVCVNVKNQLDRNNNETLTNDEINIVKYAKIKLIYQVAREGNKEFFSNAQLEERIDYIKTKKDFDDFLKYIEALVAYHKFYDKNGGK